VPEWPGIRSRHARQAAVHAREDVTAAAGSAEERTDAWRGVELAPDLECGTRQPEPGAQA
jgi:hypothetical protein